MRLYILVKCCDTEFPWFLEGKTHFYHDHKDREIHLTTSLTNTESVNIRMCTGGTNMREHVLSGSCNKKNHCTKSQERSASKELRIYCYYHYQYHYEYEYHYQYYCHYHYHHHYHHHHRYYYYHNRIYNKILDGDWFSARLFVTWVSNYR